MVIPVTTQVISAQPAAAADNLTFPLATSKAVIESQSPLRWCFNSLSNCHHSYNAADIFAPPGTPVVSPVNGTVVSATTDTDGVGSRVQIKEDDGDLWYLAHMHHSPGLHVSANDRVTAGRRLGYVGTSAHAVGTQPHLHIDKLPPSYSSRPPCSGTACASHPFVNIQPALVEAYNRAAPEPQPEHLEWFQRDPLSSGTHSRTFVFGRTGDIPLVGDWDGNGSETPGVYRFSTAEFHLKNSNTGGAADLVVKYGRTGQGQWPVVGDWDGDGDDTVGVFDLDTAQWLLRNSNTAGSADIDTVYGTRGDFPVVGDWDGDGDTTFGVLRDTSWLLRNTNSAGSADHSFDYGRANDFMPVVGDWNASGGSDGIGVVRGNQWLLRYSLGGGAAQLDFTFGQAGDYFLPGDWDGNGQPGPGVVRLTL